MAFKRICDLDDFNDALPFAELFIPVDHFTTDTAKIALNKLLTTYNGGYLRADELMDLSIEEKFRVQKSLGFGNGNGARFSVFDPPNNGGYTVNKKVLCGPISQNIDGFEIYMDVTPGDTLWGLIGSVGGPDIVTFLVAQAYGPPEQGYDLCTYTSATGNYSTYIDDATLTAVRIYKNTRYVINLVGVGDKIHLYIDGKLRSTSMDLPVNNGETGITFMCSGQGYSDSAGILHQYAAFNTKLTDKERENLWTHNVVPEYMVGPAGPISEAYPEFIRSNDIDNLITVSGYTVDKIGGQYDGSFDGVVDVGFLSVNEYIPAQSKLKITYTCTLNSGLAADLPALVYGDYGSLTFNTKVLPGKNVVVCDTGPWVIERGGYNRFTLNFASIYGSGSGAVNFTMSDIKVERIGLCVRYEENNMTSRRMLDSSGNNYHHTFLRGCAAIHKKPRTKYTETIDFNAVSGEHINRLDWVDVVRAGVGSGYFNPIAPGDYKLSGKTTITAVSNDYSIRCFPTTSYDSPSNRWYYQLRDINGLPMDSPHISFTITWEE